MVLFTDPKLYGKLQEFLFILFSIPLFLTLSLLSGFFFVQEISKCFSRAIYFSYLKKMGTVEGAMFDKKCFYLIIQV